MKKNRIIPVLFLKNGWLVQSKSFINFKNLGNPTTSVKRLSEWGSDEVIYIDITKDEDKYSMNRSDINSPDRENPLQILEDVSEFTTMPITFGGRIKTIDDISARLKLGSDKVSINTIAFDNKKFIENAAKIFGSQCIVVSIDVKKIDDEYIVFVEGGKRSTRLNVEEWSLEVEKRGAGEILINSIDRDGSKLGFDITLIKKVVDKVSVPVIALGGAGDWSDFGEVFEKTGADAVAAGNIFHHYDQSVYLARKWLYENGYNVRKPITLKI